MRNIKLYEEFGRLDFDGKTGADLLMAMDASKSAIVFYEDGDKVHAHVSVEAGDIDPESEFVTGYGDDGETIEMRIENISFIENMTESLHEGKNSESLKKLLGKLKDASDEQIERMVQILAPRMTWGLISDLAVAIGADKDITK